MPWLMVFNQQNKRVMKIRCQLIVNGITEIAFWWQSRNAMPWFCHQFLGCRNAMPWIDGGTPCGFG